MHLREVGVVLDQLGLKTSSSQQLALQKLFRSILQGLSAIKAMATVTSRSTRWYLRKASCRWLTGSMGVEGQENPCGFSMLSAQNFKRAQKHAKILDTKVGDAFE
jgi:hypothetical protein